MATATKTKAHGDAKRLRDQEEALEELRSETLPRLRREREELKEKIASALSNGGDPDAPRERRREVEETIEDFEAAAEVLEDRIRSARGERLREEAEDRLRSIRKKVGGLAGEAPRRAKKARELAEKLTRQLEWLSHAPLRRQLHQTEARKLASAFDLTVPDLRRYDEDPREVTTDVKRTVRQADSPRSGLGLLDDVRDVVGVLGRLFDEDSPSLGLLERRRELDDEGGEG